MAKLTNSPNETTVLELEARKSFSFSVQFASTTGVPVDLSSSVVTFTLGSDGTYDAPPTVLLERDALVPDPMSGAGLFALQADELDLDAGEYPFVIVLRTQGYSMVAVKGLVRVEQNVEFDSTAHDYAPTLPSTGLLVQLAGAQVVRVVLDYAPQGGGDQGLPATGVALGWVPTAQGDNTWEWKPGNAHEHSATQITSGTLSPDRIADWSLLRTKATRETPDNLLPNGMFETGNKGYPWTQDPRFTWTTADRPPVGNTSPGAIVTQAGLGTNSLYDQNYSTAGFMVEQGVAYDFEMWIKADKPNSRLYVEVRDDNGVQAMNWTAIEGGAGASSYPVSNWVVPTTWTRVVSRGVPTPNPTTKRSWARMGSWYLNHSNGTERNASYTIGGIRIRRALAPLVDPVFQGTLTAPNVVADDVHANFELSTGPASSLLSLAYGTISATEDGTPAPVYMPTGIDGLPTPTADAHAAPKGYVDDLVETVAGGISSGNRLVGYNQNVTNSGYVTSSTATNVLTHTVNVIAGRRYRVSFAGMTDGTVASDIVTIQLWAGASIMLQQWSGQANSQNASTSQGFYVDGFWVATVTGPVQFRATLARAIGTGNVRVIASASYPMILSIEEQDESVADVGWTEVTTYSADWRHLPASNYGPVRYRIVNGMLEINGPAQTVVARSGGTSYAILTLPVGARPVYNQQVTGFSASIGGTGISSGAFSTYMCFITPEGVLSVYPGITAATISANGYVYLQGRFPLN